MELIGKGVLNFRIKHRFGELTHEASQLFGLDQANCGLLLIMVLQKNISIGFGRSTLNKELDAFVKYKPAW